MEIKITYNFFLLFLLLMCLKCHGCMDEERVALHQIKSSINSPQGTAFSSWYGEDCCQWEGVECNPSTTRVIRISFHHRRDQSLPELWYPNATLFAQFKDLQELDLPGNQIGGLVSPNELARLKQLQKIDFRDNSIKVGSHLCWGKIPSLRFLDLSTNKLQGNIPKCLCENLRVKELFLSDNLLIGNIGTCLRNMTSLEHVDLSDNSFNGSFPSLPISNLTNIQSVILSGNEFKGRISLSHFANLSRLSYLDISWNSLEVETESITWVPSFNLSVLNLAACNLKIIPSFISSQRHLESLDLSYNSLIGKIPSWMLDNVSKKLQLRRNGFIGPFPKSSQNSSQLSGLDISDNFLSGSFPEDIGLNIPALRYLNASWNNFSGRLPPSFVRMKQLLFLELSGNQFNGEIPYGMTSNMSSLEYLGLSRNNLTGDVLPKNSSLPKLRWLYLHRNHLTGNFPDSLSKSMDLLLADIRETDMSGELSSYLHVLPQIRVLLLGGNNFEGEIPQQLCQMRHLHVLDLSRNNLSGGIPKCIDNITSWTNETPGLNFPWDPWTTFEFNTKGRSYTYRGRYTSYLLAIDMSLNRSTGTIPLQMTQLDQIRTLNLSNNLLTGQIPVTFTNMKQLESLDLSRNILSGKVPPELIQLNFLEVFYVSFNNLSGRLPLPIGQFGAFDKSCYLGNPGLCGPPLDKECDEVLEKPPSFFPNKATINTLLLPSLCVPFFFFF
ncbi:hypothetical protein SLA2020_056790 [Shorea laevis]